jgi:transposase-like protein
MTTRNDNIKSFFTNANYALTEGRPHTKSDGSRAWDNRTRVLTASQVVDREITVSEAAELVGCCKASINNWVKTLDANNPRMNG